MDISVIREKGRTMKRILAIVIACCAFVLAMGLVACGGSSSGSTAASGSAAGSAASASGASGESSGAKAQAQADGYLDRYGLITAKALTELDGAELTKIADSSDYKWDEKHAAWSKIGSDVSPSRGLTQEESEAAGHSISDLSQYKFTAEEIAGLAKGGKGTPIKWLASSKAAYTDVADVLASQQVKIVDQCEVDHRNYGTQTWAIIENSAGERFLLVAMQYDNASVYKVFTADYIATESIGIASEFNLGDYLLRDVHTIDGAMEVLKSGQVS